jgi:hypothetical protein
MIATRSLIKFVEAKSCTAKNMNAPPFGRNPYMTCMYILYPCIAGCGFEGCLPAAERVGHPPPRRNGGFWPGWVDRVIDRQTSRRPTYSTPPNRDCLHSNQGKVCQRDCCDSVVIDGIVSMFFCPVGRMDSRVCRWQCISFATLALALACSCVLRRAGAFRSADGVDP